MFSKFCNSLVKSQSPLSCKWMCVPQRITSKTGVPVVLKRICSSGLRCDYPIRDKDDASYKLVKCKPIVERSHDEKNMKLGRPMSPHLTIYGTTFTASVSILHRISGVILSFEVFVLSWATLFSSEGVNSIIYYFHLFNFGTFGTFVVKYIFAYVFWYHYTVGIRYLAWAAGQWVSLDKVYQSEEPISVPGTNMTKEFPFDNVIKTRIVKLTMPKLIH